MRCSQLCLAIAFLTLPLAAQTTDDYRREAAQKYPDLRKDGSPMQKRFEQLRATAAKKDPSLMKLPAWPLQLAERAAHDLGLAPATQGAGSLVEVNAPFTGKIEDTELFFADFLKQAAEKPRDQFETQPEYEARRPKLDTKKVFYFQLSAADAAYAYDIDSQELAIFGGLLNEHLLISTKLGKKTPLKVASAQHNLGSYEAKNVFGTKVTVKKGDLVEYYFHLTNADAIPSDLRLKRRDGFAEEQVKFTVTVPRDEAKALAPNLKLIAAVRFFEYSQSVSESISSTQPSISNPNESEWLYDGIDAELVSLHVVNLTTKNEVLRWNPQQ